MDVLETETHALRFIYGRPELVEAECHRMRADYVCTNLFYYVVDNHLEVVATMLHVAEIRKSQLMNIQPPGSMRRQ